MSAHHDDVPAPFGRTRRPPARPAGAGPRPWRVGSSFDLRRLDPGWRQWPFPGGDLLTDRRRDTRGGIQGLKPAPATVTKEAPRPTASPEPETPKTDAFRTADIETLIDDRKNIAEGDPSILADKNVLVVDDDPDVRLFSVTVLEEHGYTPLEAGDGVGYGRPWVADRPTWVATLPVGHADGYPRETAKGGKILIKEQLYPVIGAVSASHCIVNVGDHRSVQVGDMATLIGPDDPILDPNNMAENLGISVYDILMHLNPTLPRILVEQ